MMPRKNKTSTNRPAEVISNRKTRASEILTFPVKPLSPHGIQFIFKEYNFTSFVADGQGRYTTNNPLAQYQKTNDDGKTVDLESTLSIELPFPTALTDANGIQVAGIERDLVTAAVGESLTKAFSDAKAKGAGGVAAEGKKINQKLQSAGESLYDAYQEGSAGKGGFGGGVAKMAEKVMDVVDIGINGAKLLASYMARNFLGDISKTIAMDSGLAINPQETLVFDGVDLKTYTFDWQLYPTSKADSDRIRELVYKLKQRILPKMSGGGFGEKLNAFLQTEGALNEKQAKLGAVNRIFLSYPDTVIINLIGVDESHWPLFKPAMCTSIDIDYTGGGDMVIAKGGRPAAVTLSMSFSELVIHTQDDYNYDALSNPSVDEDNPK